MERDRVGMYALVIAIVGCGIKSYDLKDGEEIGMRRYPVSAEDAFLCYEGEDFESETRNPSYYDYNEKIRYKYIS